jgi:hypothetical protein
MLLPSPRDTPTFLVDRALGRHVFPQRVVACGYRCLTLADFYGDEQAAQAAADTAWLADAASHELVILTRDGNLYVNEHERLALERYNHRVFWIGPKKGTGQDWADTFEAHHQAIARYARQPGPFVVKVQRGGLQRAWP